MATERSVQFAHKRAGSWPIVKGMQSFPRRLNSPKPGLWVTVGEF
jgi:hypothetical protein